MQTILLVEDDPFLTDIYTTKIREAGFEVTIAQDGEDALLKLKEGNAFLINNPEAPESKSVWPDLLVLDLVLPKLNGWEVLGKIKNDKILKNIKVIILSNLNSKEEVEKGLNWGAVKYLVKANHTPSEIINEIKTVLS